ncbi:MAG: domain containing protein [Solirubrobacterales bacterium]|nr:domain containing protein [Solirubrobacterales bacterium]
MVGALIVSFLLAGALSASATASTITITKNVSPRPGRPLSFSFVARRLRPGSRVSPFVLTGPTSSCCGVGVGKTATVPPSGRVQFRLRWPDFYYRCLEDHGRDCRRAHWRPGEKAKIEVSTSDPHLFPHPLRRSRALGPQAERRSLMATASAATPGPVDPLPSRDIPYGKCPGSSWMSEAGTTGSGAQTEISFAPTTKARLIGIYFSGDVWSDLEKCAHIPTLTDEQYESVYAQFLCHLEYGVVPNGLPGSTGPTYDFQAWRPKASYFTIVKEYCSPKLGADAADGYEGKIIQWTADPNPQKTAWLIERGSDGELQRRWIPTSQIYYCLKAKGHGGPIELDHDFIAGYMGETARNVGQTEACGAAGPTPPGSVPSPAALPPGGYYVQYADGGVYWRSGPDWNTAEAMPGVGFYPGTIVRPTCYQAGAANVPGSADAMWEQASQVGGPGGGSGWINEHFVADGQALGQPSPGIPACTSSAPPPAPPTQTTWSEQETPNHPVNTFTNYHNASGMGPAIAAGQWVEVSCKVYDPTIASVNPDGYWYRIASSPWNNGYYSPANTFMNGDPYGGPYTHNTDFSVPDC